MVHRIAQQMHQRIADFIDYCTVKLGFSAGNNQIDFFVQRFRQIPYHPRETVKYGIYRNHPQLHDNVL
ncbi:hypothetical protein D3C80_2137050 [compost metagenome]